MKRKTHSSFQHTCYFSKKADNKTKMYKIEASSIMWAAMARWGEKNAFLAQIVQRDRLSQDSGKVIWRTTPHFKLSRLYKYVIMTNSVQLDANFTVCLNLQAFVHHHHQDRMFISGWCSSQDALTAQMLAVQLKLSISALNIQTFKHGNI